MAHPRPLRIALVGDYEATVRAHVAIPIALNLAARDLGREVEAVWIATTSLEREPEKRLAGLDAVWCVPNSPYVSMTGALQGIRVARESGRPFLGTCGGFQHALIEFARNALGRPEADHAESNPGAGLPLLSRMACSLANARGRIRLEPGSRLAALYGRTEIEEGYHCNFGPNPEYQSLFDHSALTVSGRDEAGAVRAVELEGHPFFIATLFQPEQSAFAGAPHPLIRGLLEQILATPSRLR